MQAPAAPVSGGSTVSAYIYSHGGSGAGFKVVPQDDIYEVGIRSWTNWPTPANSDLTISSLTVEALP